MLRFVASALLVVNFIFSPVLSVRLHETKVNPLELYNKLYTQCLQIPEDQRTAMVTAAQTPEQIAAYNGIKERRKSLWKEIEQFESKLEEEFSCYIWILNQPEDSLNIIRALIYIFLVSIHYHDYAKAQFCKINFIEQFDVGVSFEQKDNADTFRAIAALLTLFSDNKLFEELCDRWQRAETEGGWASTDSVNLYRGSFRELSDFRNSIKFADASEEELENLLGELPDVESITRQIEKYTKLGGEKMAYAESAVRFLFTGHAFNTQFPFRSAIPLPDSQNTKLLNIIRVYNPNSLDLKSDVRGSRVVAVLNHLLQSDFETSSGNELNPDRDEPESSSRKFDFSFNFDS